MARLCNHAQLHCAVLFLSCTCPKLCYTFSVSAVQTVQTLKPVPEERPLVFSKNLVLGLADLFSPCVQVRRFVRYTLGEGLQKKDDDFAAEVERMSQKA